MTTRCQCRACRLPCVLARVQFVLLVQIGWNVRERAVLRLAARSAMI